MRPFGETAAARRLANARALSLFGVNGGAPAGRAVHRTVRQGASVTLYTVGYERRSVDDLLGVLQDSGVEVIVDIRERATSRRPDFRKAALAASCAEAGVEYRPMSELGSTAEQREALHRTGDLPAFMRRFRTHAARRYGEHVLRLAALVRARPCALLCYERCHDECHRSVVADLVARSLDATVVAIE